MKRYVLGFAFDSTRQHVLLIEKNRPEWQAGRLNGVGGKIEPEDRNSPREAMAREFFEETGLNPPIDVWQIFAVMESPVWHIACFVITGVALELGRAPKGQEQPQIIDVDAVRAGVHPQPLSNLPWLISLALDTGEIHGRPNTAYIRYESNLP